MTGSIHRLLNGILIAAFPAAGVPASEKPLVTPKLSFILDCSDIVTGGTESRAVTRWLLEAGLTMDLAQAAGIPGGQLFAGIQVQRGADGSGFAGDIQGFSNIDAHDFEQLGEIGFAQTVLDGRLGYRFGRLDANSDFAVLEAGGEFIHSSAGFTPAISSFPSYPSPVTAANLFFEPAPWIALGGGVYDSNLEEGVFSIAELRLQWTGGGKLALGAWRDTGLPAAANRGEYALLELAPADGLSVFMQYGGADDLPPEIDVHVAAGVVMAAPFQSRPADTAGLYFSRAGLGRSLGTRGEETALELFYGFRACRSIVVRPDLQYILNPAGDPAAEDAFVLTIRLEFNL